MKGVVVDEHLMSTETNFLNLQCHRQLQPKKSDIPQQPQN